MVEGEGEDDSRLTISAVIELRGCEGCFGRIEAKISQFEGSSIRSAAVHHSPHLLLTRTNILPTTSIPTNLISIGPVIHHFPRSFLLSTTSLAAYPFTSSSLAPGSSSTPRL